MSSTTWTLERVDRADGQRREAVGVGDSQHEIALHALPDADARAFQTIVG
jgi:hypothetical protein